MAYTKKHAGPPPAGIFSIHVEAVKTTPEKTEVKHFPGRQPDAYGKNLNQDALLQRMSRVRAIVSGLEAHLRQLSGDKAKNKSGGGGGDAEVEDKGFQLGYLQATLGVELARTRQEEVLLERQLIQRDMAAGLTSQRMMETVNLSQIWRFVLVGGDLWRNLKEKLRLGDPSAVLLRQPGCAEAETLGIREKLVALYKENDGLDSRKQPVNWESDAVEYYSANPLYHGRSKNEGWCHITGTWYPQPLKATHIVPFALDANKLAEIVFGSIATSVQSPANALLLRPGFHCWLKEYKFVIVPVDRFEGTLTRWRLDVVCPDEDDPHSLTHDLRGWTYGKDVDGKELSFLGENRPATKFLYFHFIITLVRIKDLGRKNWRQTWARYYQERPFPAPSSYMRRSVIRALATHFSVADTNVVDSWMRNHGFESYHIQDDMVKKEIARRVHLFVLEDSSKNDDYDRWDEALDVNR
ncbi:hypothetical protein J3F83DRAFT_725378 [Trichoderma novae-zelandiae]